MSSEADLAKVYELASYLINERGYLVIGDVYGCFAPGLITKVLWNVDVEQPIRITERTNKHDWIKQIIIAKQHFSREFQQTFYKTRERVRCTPTTLYWRAITD